MAEMKGSRRVFVWDCETLGKNKESNYYYFKMHTFDNPVLNAGIALAKILTQKAAIVERS